MRWEVIEADEGERHRVARRLVAVLTGRAVVDVAGVPALIDLIQGGGDDDGA